MQGLKTFAGGPHPKLLQRLSQASLQDTTCLLLLVQALLHLLLANIGTLSQLCLQTFDLQKCKLSVLALLLWL